MRPTSRDIEEATSDRHLSKTRWSSDPKANLAFTREQLNRLGVRIVPKKPWSIVPKMTTAYHKKLRTSLGFDERGESAKAKTYAHELVHYRQREAVGRHRFNLQYILRPRRRWVFEVQAYRESVRVLKAQGAGSIAIANYASKVVENLRKKYLLRMSKATAEKTRQLLIAAGG